MDRKTRILIIGIVVAILILLLVINIRKKSKIESDEEKSLPTTTYDEENAFYKVVDKETGEVLYEGSSEADAYLYQIDPTFESSNPDAIDEYSFSEEFEEAF